MMSSLDFTHSSRKGKFWPTTTKLDQTISKTDCGHLVKVGNAPIEHQGKREITKEWRAYRRRPLDEGTSTVTPISPEEVNTALKNMKCGKTPGYDNIHPEFLTNLGPRARKWLAIFLTRIISEKNLPRAGELQKQSPSLNLEKTRKWLPAIDQFPFSQCVINCWRGHC